MEKLVHMLARHEALWEAETGRRGSDPLSPPPLPVRGQDQFYSHPPQTIPGSPDKPRSPGATENHQPNGAQG